MSASVSCPVCHRAASGATDYCAACGAPIEVGELRSAGKGLKSIAAWRGLDGLIAAQATAGSYWFLRRPDYRRLTALVESWSAPEHPVRRLLAAKLYRGIICDADQLLQDVAAIGSEIEFRIGSDVESCVLADPAAMQGLHNPVAVASPLGALLLGMIQGRSLRGNGPDGVPFALVVEAVRFPGPARIAGSPDGPRAAAAGA